jgi:nickel-dependent lactate racemase
MSYTVPYGTDTLTFTLPAGMQGTLIESAPLSSPGDAITLAKEALEHPLDSPTLMDLAAKRGIKRVCIVFTDTSRACPDQLLVPLLLRQLEKAGVSPQAITLL